MIDIHTHILPWVDDGAESMDMALELLKEAWEGGTKELVVTPHCAPEYGFYNFDGERLAKIFRQLCRKAYEENQMKIVLHPGMEVLYAGKSEMLRRCGDYFPLCAGTYLLMEYYFDVDEKHFLEGIDTARICGFYPVIAHPERYKCVQENIRLIEKGRKLGAMVQINKGSLSGYHGRRACWTGEQLLEKDLADVIASDAHRPKYRGSSLRNVERYITDRYGKKRADILFRENPGKIICGSKIEEETGEQKA